ncbi:MAG TPA: RDD family protein [Candidatus Limnocylindria bacterium]|nr:RDD family protein [Candidatus Limnocylindria bacterium]
MAELAETASATSATAEKVGFLTRVVAFVIDAVLVGIVSNVLTSLAGGDVQRGSGIGMIVGLAYCLYFWSASGGGQTLGMRALNVKVVKTSGAPLTVVDALVRCIGLIVSFFVAFLGVIWVAFDAQKQGWHDKIAGTFVVKA